MSGAGWVAVGVEIDAEFRSDLELASVNKWPRRCAREPSWWFWLFHMPRETPLIIHYKLFLC